MTAKGWTITETAVRAGLTRSNVSEWLAGKADMTTASLSKLAKALGITIKIGGR